jgi:superfamily II helicase
MTNMNTFSVPKEPMVFKLRNTKILVLKKNSTATISQETLAINWQDTSALRRHCRGVKRYIWLAADMSTRKTSTGMYICWQCACTGIRYLQLSCMRTGKSGTQLLDIYRYSSTYTKYCNHELTSISHCLLRASSTKDTFSQIAAIF